ncbi:SpoIID/LytB domain-containing protein [Paenibacillus sp. SYP-B4298]|uniref:SpoIID/LytB domain-containing protein n=1 Tax=Paenibacillus sp. SYP-B4298 TaxID=2996034 RepID=UPI0022DD8E59|nr:SpoIID/LytB domain-containing protein [Paenibacillus sp. SYP-B4298]
MFKQSLRLGLLLSLVFSLAISLVTNVSAESSQLVEAGPEQVIQQHVSALNNKDWETYIQLEVTENQLATTRFIENTDYQQQSLGLHTVESVSISELKTLPNEFVSRLTNFSYYEEKYENLHSYLVGLDFKVIKEDKYFFDGVNYRLMIIGKENDYWKVVENSIAPLIAIQNANLGFDSDTEKDAINVAISRAEGIIINKKGEVLEDLRASNEQIETERGFNTELLPEKLSPEEKNYEQGKQQILEQVDTTEVTANQSETNVISPNNVSPYRPSDQHLPPSYIRVYRNSYNRIDTPTLYNYVRAVLPNEWILYTIPKMESLKAGAMATKFVGWYRVWASPKYPNEAYDVKDTVADQVYNPEANKETTESLQAINAVGGIGIQNSSGNIFYPAYVAGVSGQPGPYHGGELKQRGADYLNDQGYNWLQILHYFYDSSTVSIGNIAPFFYSGSFWNAGETLYSYGTVTGQSEKWFKLIGSNLTVNIETVPNGAKTDTYLELYNSDLQLLASDDDSGGGSYSRITAYLATGNTYYVKVRNYNSGSAVYAGIYLTTGTVGTLTIGYATGGAYYDFYVTGDGRLTNFETLFYTTNSDTYLEVYNSNGALIASNDDHGTGSYSFIAKVPLISGQTYRVRVRNYNNGSPVFAQVTMTR